MTCQNGDAGSEQLDALVSLVSGHTILAGVFMELLIDNDIVTPDELHGHLRDAHDIAACSVGGMAAAEPIAHLQQRLIARHPHLMPRIGDH